MHNESKRTFLRQLFFLTLCSGLPINRLLAISDSEHTMSRTDIDEATRQFQSFQRQIYNHQILSKMTPEERYNQYQGLLNILEKVHEPSFKNSSQEEQLATLKEMKPLHRPANPSKQMQDLWKALYVTGGVTLGIAIFTRGKINFLTTLAGMSLSAPAGLKRIGTLLDTGLMAYGGYTIGKDMLTDSTLSAAEAINSALAPERFALGDYRFENDIEDLKIQIGSYQNNINNTQGTEGTNNESTESLLSLLMRRSDGDQHIFNNSQIFKAFLEEYVPLIGQIQEDTIKRLIAAQQRNDEQRAIEIRDQTAFLNSIQEFIGVAIIGKMAAPKEAEILNTLIAAGFQFGLSTVKPIGWASVGVKIATILSGSTGSNTFSKAVMAALRNLQKQLNVLIENVAIINQNQIVIIKQLNTIIEGINDIKELVGSKFTDLSKQSGLIYNLIEVKELQDLQGDFAEYNRRLGHAIETSNSSDIYNFIQNLTGYALQKLNTITVTQFDPSFQPSSALKSKIIIRKNYRYQISLYDSIGLTSGLAGYSSAMYGGLSENNPIVHPVHFCVTVDVIINWMMVSDLNIATRKRIANELLDKAKLSQALLLSYAGRERIEKLAEDHFRQGLDIIGGLRDFMITFLRKTYTGFALNGRSVLTNYPHNISNNYLNISAKRNDPVQYYDDNNDDIWITVARDLGVISAITRLATKNYRGRSSETRMWRGYLQRPNEVITDFNRGKTSGSKSNRITITNAFLDFQTKKTFSLQYDYTSNLTIVSVDLIKVRDYHPSLDDIVAVKVIKKVSGSIKFDPNWKHQVQQQLIAQGLDPTRYIKDFDKPHFSLQMFFRHLVEEQHKAIKSTLLQDLRTEILKPTESNYDGLGIATMYLSKLNIMAATGENRDFLLDYSESAFIREDLIALLDVAEGWDFAKMKPEDAKAILDPLSYYSDYASIYNGREYVDEIAPDFLYTEMLTSIMFKMVTETRNKVLKSLHSISDNAGEPFLAESIMKLTGFLKLLET